MAKCEVCKMNMMTADGCSVAKIHINGTVHERIRVNNFMNPEIKRCGDCNAKNGHYHHWGCDMERCPACGLQLISCDCENVYVEGTE